MPETNKIEFPHILIGCNPIRINFISSKESFINWKDKSDHFLNSQKNGKNCPSKNSIFGNLNLFKTLLEFFSKYLI